MVTSKCTCGSCFARSLISRRVCSTSSSEIGFVSVEGIGSRAICMDRLLRNESSFPTPLVASHLDFDFDESMPSVEIKFLAAKCKDASPLGALSSFSALASCNPATPPSILDRNFAAYLSRISMCGGAFTDTGVLFESGFVFSFPGLPRSNDKSSSSFLFGTFELVPPSLMFNRFANWLTRETSGLTLTGDADKLEEVVVPVLVLESACVCCSACFLRSSSDLVMRLKSRQTARTLLFLPKLILASGPTGDTPPMSSMLLNRPRNVQSVLCMMRHV
mmetsp:Transcript_10937/g.25439  ORF Transcript_10937/g.25439 Transcript_10937/m.25439 type:complete len:276 (-) Transcript_10937:105-932(-)